MCYILHPLDLWSLGGEVYLPPNPLHRVGASFVKVLAGYSALKKSSQNTYFYIGLETLSISGLPMFPTCIFKIIDFAGEVSHKSRFQEVLKTVHLHLNLSMINIASIWPLKKPSKTLII